jgi:hypothetical protein
VAFARSRFRYNGLPSFFLSMKIFMKQLLIAAYAVAIIAGVNVLFQTKAAAVNCSYDACIKQCSKDGATNRCCMRFTDISADTNQ